MEINYYPLILQAFSKYIIPYQNYYKGLFSSEVEFILNLDKVRDRLNKRLLKTGDTKKHLSRNYIIRAIKNASIDEYRKKNYQNTTKVSEEELVVLLTSKYAHDQSYVEIAEQSSRFDTLVLEFIKNAGCSEDETNIYLDALVYEEGQEEIAKRYGICERTVRYRLTSAVGKIEEYKNKIKHKRRRNDKPD